MENPSQQNNQILCPFLSVYRRHHDPKNPNLKKDGDFIRIEKIFLGIFGLGLFETFHFLFNECCSDHHFQDWIISQKGKDDYKQAAVIFNNWHAQDLSWQETTPKGMLTPDYLSPEQQHAWEEHGYLKIEGVINQQRCDQVVELICKKLEIDLANQETWYNNHEQLQGIMLQLFQHEAIYAIRNDETIKSIFCDLYQSTEVIANTDKLGYNPPLKKGETFKGSPLHWDFEPENGPGYYIQGLVYLNDVPENRGAFTLIPGFHHQIKPFLNKYQDNQKAIDFLRKQKKEIHIPGKKGDLILWLESLPHAASANHSDLPRFVQYISFNKMR